MLASDRASALPRRDAPDRRFTTARTYAQSMGGATYSLFGVQLHSTLSIDQPSSPHIVADASLVSSLPVGNETFAELSWTARRFFDCGAHTTRHEIEQST